MRLLPIYYNMRIIL
ncbi:UNVERIFIED_CONTAM: hypothetical protein GTU68_038924 [Idotea baltica]|nr:hypothetical protein [Idotea baltica]